MHVLNADNHDLDTGGYGTGYRRLSLLVHLNGDRLFSLGTIVVGLLAGAFLGSVLINL